MAYGYELIMDLQGCDVSLFNRHDLKLYLIRLCEKIDMIRADLHFWDYDTEEEMMSQPEHLAGTSACQFIFTSNIVIHTLNKLGDCYMNIFSCKRFDEDKAMEFTMEYFNASHCEEQFIERGKHYAGVKC